MLAISLELAGACKPIRTGGVSTRTSHRLMNINYRNHGNDMHHLFLWQPLKLFRCVSNGERLHRQRCFIEALVCVPFYRRKFL